MGGRRISICPLLALLLFSGKMLYILLRDGQQKAGSRKTAPMIYFVLDFIGCAHTHTAWGALIEGISTKLSWWGGSLTFWFLQNVKAAEARRTLPLGFCGQKWFGLFWETLMTGSTGCCCEESLRTIFVLITIIILTIFIITTNSVFSSWQKEKHRNDQLVCTGGGQNPTTSSHEQGA